VTQDGKMKNSEPPGTPFAELNVRLALFRWHFLELAKASTHHLLTTGPETTEDTTMKENFFGDHLTDLVLFFKENIPTMLSDKSSIKIKLLLLTFVVVVIGF
jgi:hypothetical protein